MKKNVLLLLVNVVVTVAAAFVIVRWVAPPPVERPLDLQVVQLDEKMPPFYESVFANDGRVLNDPLTVTRMRRLVPENLELTGPFDILGFRNRAVPIVADVVAIGDSQTVGRNATLDGSWPSRVAAQLPVKHPVVYSMASGGWGPVQYLYMAEKALAFRPRVLVVAFYTGNDAWDAIKVAYSLEPWRSLRGLPSRPPDPPGDWPPRPSDLWPIDAGGYETVLTPRARLVANDRSLPATTEGLRIMAEVGRRIGSIAARAGTKVVFTIIPTKELVYAMRVARDASGSAPPDYARLVDDEGANIAELARALRDVPGATYVDLVRPLQQAALDGVPLYPPSQNGHPIAPGYEAIAQVLAPVVDHLLPAPVSGLVRVAANPDDAEFYGVVVGGGLWRFLDEAAVTQSGWTVAQAAPVTRRDVALLEERGLVTDPDPATFGPAAVEPPTPIAGG